MKLQECREALKTMSTGDPRRAKVLEEMERIQKWMQSKGIVKKASAGGLSKKKCNNSCNGRTTLPHPKKPGMCSGCGIFYNEI